MDSPVEMCDLCKKPIVGTKETYQSWSFCSKRCTTIFYFTKGHCLEYAVALNKMYGYPIRAIFSRDAKKTLVHAFCINTDNEDLPIDGRGVTSIADIMKDHPNYSETDIIDVTEEDLHREFYRDSKYINKDYGETVNKAKDCILHYSHESDIGIIERNNSFFKSETVDYIDKLFIVDMKKIGYEPVQRETRFGYSAPVVIIEDHLKIQRVIRSTDIRVDWEDYGKCYIVYPIHFDICGGI